MTMIPELHKEHVYAASSYSGYRASYPPDMSEAEAARWAGEWIKQFPSAEAKEYWE